MPKIVYMLFVASIMVGNGLYLGPCTMRQYCAVFLLVYTFINKKKLKGYYYLLPSYAVFILLYGISSIFENNVLSYLKQFIGLFCVSIVGYFSTILILQKYKNIKYFAIPFTIVGFVNGITNILQYCGISIGYAIGAIFVDFSDEVKSAQLIRIMEGDHSYSFGIMGDIVYNGYYCMLLPFFVILLLNNTKWWLQLAFVIFSLISLWVVGERSCFGITFLLLLYYFYDKYKTKEIFYFFIFSIFVIGIFYISDFINSDAIQESRWTESSSDARDNINSAIIPFIFSHFVLGGAQEFIKLTQFPAHNVVASGFIYSGFIGGICIIYMLISQAKISLFLLKNKYNQLITLAFISYTLNGLFHNPAIVTGDAMVWILWGMVIFLYKHFCHSNESHVIKSNKDCLRVGKTLK